MNPWKMTTIAIALVTGTAFTTGLTTVYLMRPPALADAATSSTDAVSPAPLRAVRSSQVATSRSSAAPRVTTATSAAPAAVVRPVAATTAADCSTGGDRAWRIAKPGVVGAALGAGLGAAGGAIANGGKTAGNGAIIGGLAGAAPGAGHGAYKTKNECGTTLGGKSSAAPVTHA